MTIQEVAAGVWATVLAYAHLLGETPLGRSLSALVLALSFLTLLVFAASRVSEAGGDVARVFMYAFFVATCTASVIFFGRLSAEVLHVATSAWPAALFSTLVLVGHAAYLILLGSATLRVRSGLSRPAQRRLLWLAGGAMALVLLADRLSLLLAGPGGAPLSGTPPGVFHAALHAVQLGLCAMVVAALLPARRPPRGALLFTWFMLLLAEAGLAGEHLAARAWALDASMVAQLAFLLHVPALFIAMAISDRKKLLAALGRLRSQFAGVLEALVNLEEVSDSALHSHSERHGDLARKVARKLDFSDDEAQEVLWAALLHDIGKLVLDRQILAAARPLTPEEWAVVRRHPVLGAAIIEDIPGLERVASYIRHHHERWDGTGYPDGLRGEAIPMGARIVAVVDTFDAMLSTRSYRRPRTLLESVGEIRGQAGRQFDPEVVASFVEVLEEQSIPMVEDA